VRLVAFVAIVLATLYTIAIAQKVVSPQVAPAPVPLQPPSPGAREPGSPQEPQPNTGQQSAAGEQRGTDQVPLTVKVLPTPKSQSEIDEDQHRADDHATNERGLTTATWTLAGFTLLLAFIATGQIALFFWQLRLIRESLDDARLAADAAMIEAEATKGILIVTHRPRLRVRNIVVNREPRGRIHPPPQIFAPGYFVSGQFYVSNIGGSEATITESHCEVIWNTTGLPMERPYEGKDGNMTIGRIRLQPGVSRPGLFLSENVMGSEGTAVQTGSGGMWGFWVMGWIEYIDASNTKRRTAFCRKYRVPEGANEGRFFAVDDTDYEHEE